MATHKLILEVEEALANSRMLDRDLIRELVDLTRALETALFEACKSNLELQAMDRNIATAADKLRDATNALSQAYTQDISIDDSEVEQTVLGHIEEALTKINS